MSTYPPRMPHSPMYPLLQDMKLAISMSQYGAPISLITWPHHHTDQISCGVVTTYLLEAVECGVWIVDVVLVHLVRQHEQVLLLGEPYHSLDIGAGQDLGRGDVSAN